MEINRPDEDFGTTTLTRPKSKPLHKTPKMYQVLLHNDDFTPREFVVLVLEKFFAKNENAAIEIMMKAHSSGIARVAVYSFGMAETKAYQANEYAKGNKLPLCFSVEPVDGGAE